VAAAVGIVAIAAAFAIGMTGWPPARATAAPASGVVEFGVGDEPAVTLASEVDPADKFLPTSPSAAAGSMAAGKRLHTAEAKKFTKPAVKRAAPRKVRATRPRVTAVAATGTGWRSARASWYGPGFYGNTMAGGGKLTPSSMVVAHRSMPFGTRVQISYGGRSVTAVVRDRGPYVGGRTFDLGPGTAKALGFSGVGTIKWRIVGG
jgi:rare lipoprotein A (peptidoglycan hydrolase)